MKDYLCKCNNCDSILVDENPQTGAIKKKVPKDFEYMESLWDIGAEMWFWACPKCKTDDYLTDNIE